MREDADKYALRMTRADRIVNDKLPTGTSTARLQIKA